MCRYAPGPQSRQDVKALARDGTALHIRDAHRDDRDAIQLLFDELSPRSTYQRFLSASPRGGEHYAEVLFDPRRTLDAVVATVGGELVAVGSTHQLSVGSAELALAIADRHQVLAWGRCSWSPSSTGPALVGWSSSWVRC